LRKIKILKEFIEEREQQIERYNREHGYIGEDAINARRQTNIGLYRRYIEYYLRNNEHVNRSMPLVVRQLSPSEIGVPVEIYCFTKTKEWNAYEGITADIFDHIFAVTHYFELTIFENPSGRDLKGILKAD
jgi:miniconductance mechanosensitive channel